MIVLLLLLHITEALVQQNQHPIIMNGDIIFVQPPLNKESAFGKAIEKTGDATIRWWNERRINKTQSNDTAIHAAVYVGNDTIVEAVPDFGVRTNNVSVFFEEYPPNTIFYFGRVSPPLQSSLRSVLLSEIGKPYANDFDSPPQSFYCSSLVTYAYKKALNISFSPPFELIFEPREYWRQYYAALNESLPPKGTLGSNPTLLLHSPIVNIYHTREKKLFF